MSVYFAFAVFLALAAAQCSLEGKTYANNARSVTFGAAVGSWVPVLINQGTAGDVVFHSVNKATAARWEWVAVGSPSGEFCTGKGQYNVHVLNDCKEVTFVALSDPCNIRAQVLSETFSLVEDPQDGSDCVAAGRVLHSSFKQSTSSPILSTEAVTWDEFAIASVGTVGAIFQKWEITYQSGDEVTMVRDFASYPDGLACSKNKFGSYNTTWGENCDARLCGIEDGCEARGQLLHKALVNDWTAPEEDTGCFQRSILTPGYGGQSRCSIDEQQWLGHPYDCVNQEIDGGCMFCRGIAGGRTVSLCLDRLGALCDDIFETDARRMYCNLEFECPASTLTATLAVFISAFLALFH